MFVSADNCGVVIPCHNEAASVADVVGRLRTLLPAVPFVLVVDDGSTDASAALASAAGAEVVRLPVRSGKGAALAAGWSATARAGCDWVLMMDGDGQHLPEESPALLAAAAADRLLVVGNRLHAPEALPRLRRATNRWMSRRVSRLAGYPLPDSQCGFRLAHLPTLLGLGLTTEHFEIESEMCVAFARAGHKITFVDVTASYGRERSKICPLLDAWRWVQWYHRTRRLQRCGGPEGSRKTALAPCISS